MVGAQGSGYPFLGSFVGGGAVFFLRGLSAV